MKKTAIFFLIFILLFPLFFVALGGGLYFLVADKEKKQAMEKIYKDILKRAKERRDVEKDLEVYEEESDIRPASDKIQDEVSDVLNQITEAVRQKKEERGTKKAARKISDNRRQRTEARSTKSKVLSTKSRSSKESLNERQNRLYELIKTNKEMSMYDIHTMFNQVTQRTLRRDLEKLEESGLVKQAGKTRNSVYTIA